MLQALVAKGALGQKSGAGFFPEAGKDIQVLDVARQDYRIADGAASAEVAAILKVEEPG